MRQLHWVCALALVSVSGGALALEGEIADGAVSIKLNTKVSIGAAWRMQDRTNSLIGKLNVPGQQDLCSTDNCLGEATNLALVNADGAFSGINGDDGNLNYDKYDIVAATTKLNADLTVTWDALLARVRVLGFYDPANVNFDEQHTYTCQDSRNDGTCFQPETTPRPLSIENVNAMGANLYDAYLQYAFDWAGRSGVISVGHQTIRWGESTLVALNSLSEINPPNAAVYRMPGVEFSEVFQPVPAVMFSSDIFEGVSAELVYLYGWKPAQPDPRGSFFSDSDLIGGRNAYIQLGQFGEDPERHLVAADPLGMVTSTTITTYLLPPNEPKDGGEYGLRLGYFAEWLNHGTDLGFYFLNYHSRLPYATIYATNNSCARDSTNAAEAATDCMGFNGAANPIASHDPNDTAFEPLPIETLKAHLEYPTDIQMYGLSFNTNIGSWSLAGEYSFRPNVPMQVHLTDLIFMGLNPAFPEEDIDLGVGVLPAARNGAPSYLLTYRGKSYTDDATRVQANERIEGYERMKVGQLDFTAIRALSDNPFAAEQVIIILEAGMTQVFGMPSRDQLQFEGGGPNRTHASPGADGTGSGGVVDTRRFNPTQQTVGFADDLAWGLRSITRLEYNDVVLGWNFLPTMVLSWDVKGIAPYPFQNFVEGRKEISAGTEINFSQALSGHVTYQWFTGGGRENTRKDRDNLAISFSYAF